MGWLEFLDVVNDIGTYREELGRENKDTIDMEEIRELLAEKVEELEDEVYWHVTIFQNKLLYYTLV